MQDDNDKDDDDDTRCDFVIDVMTMSERQTMIKMMIDLKQSVLEMCIISTLMWRVVSHLTLWRMTMTRRMMMILGVILLQM